MEGKDSMGQVPRCSAEAAASRSGGTVCTLSPGFLRGSAAVDQSGEQFPRSTYGRGCVQAPATPAGDYAVCPLYKGPPFPPSHLVSWVECQEGETLFLRWRN